MPYSFDDVTTAALAISVSEPASLALVGLALAGLAASRQRGKQCQEAAAGA